MKIATTSILAVILAAALTAPASAVTVKAEHVTGGVLDNTWVYGYNTPQNLVGTTLASGDAAYANPSGDHTVGVLTNADPNSGGIALSCTDPLGQADYIWEADFFTGAGDSRRGLVLRADPTNGFTSCYQFVIQSGLFQINFRKLLNQTPQTLATWYTTSLPGVSGSLAQNTWHHMKVVCSANAFDCYFDGTKLNANPIIDGTNPLLSGWVGVYNFRFDIGGIATYWDELTLSTDNVVPTHSTSWGRLKALYH